MKKKEKKAKRQHLVQIGRPKDHCWRWQWLVINRSEQRRGVITYLTAKGGWTRRPYEAKGWAKQQTAFRAATAAAIRDAKEIDAADIGIVFREN
jgi:hypothetical protein